MSAKNVAGSLGLGALGIIGVILLVIVLFVFGTAVTALLVALVWNVCNLHVLFGADPLSFWQVVGVAVGINLLRSIFTRNVTVQQ
jgi:hypothetical protein